MDRNTLKTTFLLTLLAALFVGIGSFWGKPGLIIGLVVALLFTFSSYWFSDKIAIKAARGVPVSEAQMPDYYAVVRDLCTRANLPMPRLYVTPDAQPNAFATGRNPKHAAVAVTQGILQMCTWDELRGVLAHEMSHVGNRDILISSVAATVAMAITLLSRFAAYGGLFLGGNRRDEGENMFELLALIILAPLAAMLLQLALSRSREYEADRSGARMIGDGEPLARALAKLDSAGQQIPMPQVHREMAGLYIMNPLAGGRNRSALNNWFSDHPPTADRIARLRSGEWAK
jgi:heat shock protein HtpX